MDYLLGAVDRLDCRGIRLRSLEATTIPALMEDVAKWQCNLAHLAHQVNFRGAAPIAKANFYSRNIAHREPAAPDFAQSVFARNLYYMV